MVLSALMFSSENDATLLSPDAANLACMERRKKRDRLRSVIQHSVLCN